MFYEKNIDLYSRWKLAEDLSSKLQELMVVYCENFYYTQKFQNQVYNKGIKPRKYAPNDKIWLNRKYIKIN